MSTRNLTYFHERQDGPPFACISTKGEPYEYGRTLVLHLRPVRVSRGLRLPFDGIRVNGMGELAGRTIAALWNEGECPSLVPLAAAERDEPMQDWLYHVWPETDVAELEPGVAVRVGVTRVRVDSGETDGGIVDDEWWVWA